MKNKKYLLVLLSILTLGLILYLVIKPDKMCPLSEDLEQKINSVNTTYGELLQVENVPCENNYIRIVLKTNTYENSLLDTVHGMLYDSKEKQGWKTLMVFNAKKEYVFSHSSNGKIYRQTGD